MEAWTPVAVIALGFGSQWLFAIKRIPNSLVYAGIAGLSVVLYLMGCNCKPRWDRDFFIASFGWIFLLVQSIRGSAGMTKDAKMAPKTNSL